MQNQAKPSTNTKGKNSALVKTILFLFVVHACLALTFFIPNGNDNVQTAGVSWSRDIEANDRLSSNDQVIKEGMIKVTIMYPNEEGKQFDMDYYSQKHMPMIADLFGDKLKLLAIDKGIAGRTPDEPIPFLAIGYLYFDELADYERAFGPNAEKILGDIPNYTNIQPTVLISEVIR